MARKMIHAVTGEELHGAEADYRPKESIGSVAIGGQYLFYKSVTQIRVLPLADIAWAYMRQEDSRMTLCCGKGTLETFFLVLITTGGDTLTVTYEKREDVEKLLALLPQRRPEISIGYTQENIARWRTGAATPAAPAQP